MAFVPSDALTAAGERSTAFVFPGGGSECSLRALNPKARQPAKNKITVASRNPFHFITVYRNFPISIFVLNRHGPLGYHDA
jgi:hypothetical protein